MKPLTFGCVTGIRCLMPSILLVVKHAELDAHNAKIMVRIAQETSTSDEPMRQVKGATAAGDERRLRGIPCLAQGIGGAIKGSRPHVDGIPRTRG